MDRHHTLTGHESTSRPCQCRDWLCNCGEGNPEWEVCQDCENAPAWDYGLCRACDAKREAEELARMEREDRMEFWRDVAVASACGIMAAAVILCVVVNVI